MYDGQTKTTLSGPSLDPSRINQLDRFLNDLRALSSSTQELEKATCARVGQLLGYEPAPPTGALQGRGQILTPASDVWISNVDQCIREIAGAVERMRHDVARL
jgi:hypothetical protein